MDLYLQFGYGMMDHCRHLLDTWAGGTVILSPRDLEPDRLISFSREITDSHRGRVLFDPQLYLPHSDHSRLCSHNYWPRDYDTGVFWQGEQVVQLLSTLLDLNQSIGSSEFILPGLQAAQIDSDWILCQTSILGAARNLGSSLPLRVTIALSANATTSIEQVERLLETAEQWGAKAYYLVCQHPDDRYLVENPNWLASVLDIAAGLKLGGASVIIGYANQQLLVASCAKVDAIASGTWMNVRSFQPDKFSSSYNEEIRNRSTWYYCPQALSEYKIPTLDLAYRANVLHHMSPPLELDGGYATRLFSGMQPTSAAFNEQHAFRHYLHALKKQANISSRSTFDETIDYLRSNLDSAEATLRILRAAGVLGQQRDFNDIIDVNRGAIGLLNHTRGAILRRRWTELS